MLPWLLDGNESTYDPVAIGVGSGGVVPWGEGGPAVCLEKLGREGLAASWAAAVEVNMIWLVSGATVILNFLKNQCPVWDQQKLYARNWK
jgi:hypothetical protein